jgi:predicted nucleic acid-binding protein
MSIRGCRGPAEQLEKVQELAATRTKLVCDAGTAKHYGRIEQGYSGAALALAPPAPGP